MANIAMLKHIVLNGNSAIQLMNVLAQGNREDMCCLFSGVIRLWLDCMAIQIQTDHEKRFGAAGDFGPMGTQFDKPGSGLPSMRTDHTPSESWRFGEKLVDVDTYLYNLIKFTIAAAKRQNSVRLGMLDAGCLV